MNYFREMHKVKLFIEKLADYHHRTYLIPGQIMTRIMMWLLLVLSAGNSWPGI